MRDNNRTLKHKVRTKPKLMFYEVTEDYVKKNKKVTYYTANCSERRGMESSNTQQR
jgi:hypothetical protein